MVLMIKVGQIMSTFGNKGELKVFPLTDDPERFKKLKYVYLIMPDGDIKMHISSVRNHKNTVILSFKEVPDMSSAEKLRNIYICIEEEQLVKLPENHYFIFQIIGIEVYEKGIFLGKIQNVIQTGSNDVYVVKDNEKEILIPALKSIVLGIDLDEKKMFVSLPEGLVD
ncbi:MAG: hypothetical protein VR72_20790 [Clostridiaceae bacterium BRH_c20a]|nr:MAG: hypothetical protein VR72_20790 [Clostridiaceae bacterium BRH_c20a]